MTERFHLGLVKGESETIWYTLVIEFPIQYFVEKYHESKNAFFFRTQHIKPDELARHWVNDIPLVKLVENKFREIGETQRLYPLMEETVKCGKPLSA